MLHTHLSDRVETDLSRTTEHEREHLHTELLHDRLQSDASSAVSDELFNARSKMAAFTKRLLVDDDKIDANFIKQNYKNISETTRNHAKMTCMKYDTGDKITPVKVPLFGTDFITSAMSMEACLWKNYQQINILGHYLNFLTSEKTLSFVRTAQRSTHKKIIVFFSVSYPNFHKVRKYRGRKLICVFLKSAVLL